MLWCRERVPNQVRMSPSPGGHFPKYVFLGSTLYVQTSRTDCSEKSSLDNFGAFCWLEVIITTLSP